MRLIRQKLTKANNKALFLQTLAGQISTGSHGYALACAAAGVHRATPYRWRATDPDFAAQWAAIEVQRWAAWELRYAVERAERARAKAARWAELRPRFQQLAANARAAKAAQRGAA